MTFEEALQRTYEGSLSFGEFTRVTCQRWRNLAKLVARRWKLPGWTPLEDVEQELLFGVWKCLWRFDPSRGVPLARYVTYNAVDRAKKEMHKARNALHSGRGPDFNPSRLETSFASLARAGEADPETRLLARLVVEPDQIDRVVHSESTTRALAECTTLREWHTVCALSETGSIVRAALRLYDDVEARLDCRFSCERHACRVVERTAQDLAQRLGYKEEAFS